jgi:hypothetical protein
LKQEAVGSEPKASPAIALTLAIAMVGTLVLGIYPQPLFELASRSAQSLYGSGVAARIR